MSLRFKPNPSFDADLSAARETFDRRALAWDRMKDRLPPHQRAELLADLMEACDALDEAEGSVGRGG